MASYPSSFYCPLTRKLMTDPVVDSEGYTYERDAIEKWITKSAVSPLTGNSLASGDLKPNRALKVAIAELTGVNTAADDLSRDFKPVHSSLSPPVTDRDSFSIAVNTDGVRTLSDESVAKSIDEDWILQAVETLITPQGLSTPGVSRDELIAIIYQVLLWRGAIPVGEIGKCLQSLFQDDTMMTFIKTHYKGLKKFIESNKEYFLVGRDHAYNPVVQLNPSTAPPQCSSVEQFFASLTAEQSSPTPQAADEWSGEAFPPPYFGHMDSSTDSFSSQTSQSPDRFRKSDSSPYTRDVWSLSDRDRDGGGLRRRVSSMNHIDHHSGPSPAEAARKKRPSVGGGHARPRLNGRSRFSSFPYGEEVI